MKLATAADRLRHDLPVSVWVRSPFLFGSLHTHAVGVDAHTIRDEQQRPIIPEEHFKGLLRHAAEALEYRAAPTLEGLDLTDLFGPAPPPALGAEAFKSQRARLIFADLAAKQYLIEGEYTMRDLALDWFEKESDSHRSMTRIEIDDETGTAATGMLQVVELAGPLGAEVLFEGKVLFHGTRQEGEKLHRVLTKALAIVPYFGALRSVGFGEHLNAKSKIGKPETTPIINPALCVAPPHPRISVEASFDRPFLADSERLAFNIFKGRAVVPGAAVKGALAEMLERAGLDPKTGDLGKALAHLRISHGFPVAENSGNLLDRALPLASKALLPGGAPAATASDGSEDGLIDGKCAAFQSDWKSSVVAAFRAKVGRGKAEFDPLPRGRTRIDRDTGAAMDDFLFVEVALSPLAKEDPSKRVTFRFTIDFGDHPLRAAAPTLWGILQGGLDGVGKTRARLTFGSVSPLPPPPMPSLGDEPFVILLETAAALLDLDSEAAPKDRSGRTKPADQQLESYFSAILPGVNLLDAFIRLRRAGGYAAHRSRRGRVYEPMTLFEPGCCFMLGASEAPDRDAVAKRLGELLRDGLPPLRWTKGSANQLEEVADWRESPWLPKSGYGEISLYDLSPIGDV